MKFQIIDLFAGPGGLGEGFASHAEGETFRIAVSAEMESSAHRTLTLRSFFRHVRGDEVAMRAYYDFCAREDAPHPSLLHPAAWKAAQSEANQLTLGTHGDNLTLDALLRKANLREDNTVLIGGPPCQAYSLVGRSRNRGKQNYVAADDHRHFLYREYLRILHKNRPAVFVMENVKGILSSRVDGHLVFHDILRDLTDPGKALGLGSGLRYTIHSLVAPTTFEPGMDPESIDASDFIIKAERCGIPQARHRVILLGVRQDLAYNGRFRLREADPLTVRHSISSLPPLRSRLSKADSRSAWREIVTTLASNLISEAESQAQEALAKDAETQSLKTLARQLRADELEIGKTFETGAVRYHRLKAQEPDSTYCNWVKDDRLEVWLNHESRSHMPSDLGRYFYTAVFGRAFRRTPKGHREFALKGLAPEHANWKTGKFIDRFRVQLWDLPSTTVTSHIAKDGHYFIHPDPGQCRSLTVREAARLQAFPDNYFFLGTRTQQYHQVGNAVPPLLARQIAGVVNDILSNQAGSG
jgi:DNA (cytosine-5)-methyltransferase 1